MGVDGASLLPYIDACQYAGYCVCMSTAVAPAVTCAPTMAPPALDAEAAQSLARTLKAVADPARLRLLSIVAASTDGAVCVCDLTDPVGLSQPTVSHHLRVLVEAGLLAREKRGSWAYFSLVPGAVDALTGALGEVAAER